MLPFEQVLTRQKKQLTYDITDDITLKGNESSIRELISILIDNAAKYCEESGTVHVELHTVNSKIRLAITNDFPDVENCAFSAIFDRFYRADKSRKSDGSYGLDVYKRQHLPAAPSLSDLYTHFPVRTQYLLQLSAQ